MTRPEAIVREFKEKVDRKIELIPEGLNRFRVVTPFIFEDGDHLVVALKGSPNGNGWELTDEGHTFMHLSYDIDEADLRRGTRQQIISNALEAFGVTDRQGELAMQVPDLAFGDALFSFVQALLRVTDVSFLSKERVVSTFMEDFQEFMRSQVPEERLGFDWRWADRDPEGNYVVDCRINGSARPLMVFALANDARVRDATITLHQFEKWSSEESLTALGHETRLRSLGIFDNQEEISRKVLARFTDVCERQFSSLSGNKSRIASYLAEELER
ncbi:MAG: DUF1828 domain-containing protein [Actinomycetota bacterium]|nr:DUF1828 domain-containing protein [Actinomycetota bacterium]